MKIGFRTAGFREWSLPDALSAIKRLGYDGVELCLENHDLRPDVIAPARAKEVVALLADLELELASVSYHADGEALETRVPNTLRAIELASEFGGSILVLNSRKAELDRRDEQWQCQLDRFRKLCDKAAEFEVDLAVEPEPGLLVDNVTDFARLKRELRSCRLMLNLDIGHCHITDDLVPCIHTFAADIVHTHFEDLPGKEHKHLVPGEGDMDLAAVVEAFREVRYDGYVTIDLCNITEAPEEHARRALEATKALLGD